MEQLEKLPDLTIYFLALPRYDKKSKKGGYFFMGF